MQSLLDLMFKKKIFAAVCLTLLISTTIYLKFFTTGMPPDSAPQSAEVLLDARDVARLESPYEHGFRNGYNAFLAQTGRYIPRPSVSASRVASYSSNDEAVMQGYVEGYHKAADMECCPRNFHE